jgi:P-type Cu+ transporter
MAEQQCMVGVDVESELISLEERGQTAVVVAVNRQVLGVLGIADKVKSGAAACVRTLKSMGLDVWMVTGDNATTASAVALSLDIPSDRVVASCMPSDKVKKLQSLQHQGRHVAMVGDGINDSPSLAAADLGVAIGAGTQIAIDAADMILVRSNIEDVAVCLDLAKKTFQRVKINFIWALVYNVLAIPYAAGVFFPITHLLVPPQYAGLAMAFSSVSVVVNSSSLRFYRPPQSLTGSTRGGGGGQQSGGKRGHMLVPTSEHGVSDDDDTDLDDESQRVRGYNHRRNHSERNSGRSKAGTRGGAQYTRSPMYTTLGLDEDDAFSTFDETL